MSAVHKWTGRETRALREAGRMSVRSFAAYLGVNERTVTKWEARGPAVFPRPEMQAALDTALGRATPEVQQRFELLLTRGGVHAGEGAEKGQDASQSQWSVQALHVTSESLVESSEWPAWFGIRLAHLIGVIDSWPCPGLDSVALQTILHQEIQMFDVAAPCEKPAEYGLSRRQALVALAALPAASVPAAGRLRSGAQTEVFLARCAASLAACWHLLKGRDIYSVEQFLTPFAARLKAIAHSSSRHRDPAARLASQVHRICGIVALHRDQLRLREHHCRQALEYSEITSDHSSRVSALISLASTYYYGANPALASETYQQALVLESLMSPLHRSRVHAEISVAYGQLGHDQAARRSAEIAGELFPAEPERDPSFLHAEFSHASLALEQGLAFLALAERLPDRGYQHTAAKMFSKAENAPVGSVPDRIRYEIINHQAKTAILLNDLDGFEKYAQQGIKGIAQLSSWQRQKELRSAWHVAQLKWSSEPRMKTLTGVVRATVEGVLVREKDDRRR